MGVTGSCHCGGVRFEVTGRFGPMGHCHCSRCRKHSGTAVCTQGRVRREDFHLLRGAELIRAYGPRASAAEQVFMTVDDDVSEERASARTAARAVAD